MSRYKDHECLKTRTIHLKGVIPEDGTGQGIENHLNKILKQKQMRNTRGKVMSTLIIPDYTKQFELECEILDLKDYKMLMSV